MAFARRLLPFAAILVAAHALAASTQPVASDNWPQWRGPHGTGVAADGDYPVKFSGEENVVWKAELPGRGSSTPAVWGDSIFVTSGAGGENSVACYGWDGKEKWEKKLGPEVPGKHLNGSGSNASPVTDGKHLVAYFKSADLVCLDLAGEVKWQKNLAQEFGKIDLWWDLANSPVIAGENVVVAVMCAGDSYLVAFNLDTGNVAWRTPRKYQRPPESDQSYTTPQLATIGGREVIVTFGADHLTGTDAKTGEAMWDVGEYNPQNQGMWRTIASPVVANDWAVVPFARGNSLAGVPLPTHVEGNVVYMPANEPIRERWDKQQLGADVPTPAVADGKVILLADDGKIVCLKLESGEELWQAKLPKARDRFYASPILAGNLLYTIREDGTAFVGRVGEGYEKLAENSMGERVIATPIPVRGGLLVRGEKHLFWIK